MAEIIRLRGSPHEQTQALLPWHVNNTLDGDERTLVDSHLAECAECRSELALEHALARQVASLPVDAERGWPALADKLDASALAGRGAAPVPLLQRRVTIGWALSGQLAVAAALLLAVYLGQPGVPEPQVYHVLGSATPAPAGNVVVLFAPETSEKDIRSTLLSLHARVVDGPTVSGAYIVHVADERRPQALETLRATDRILLAEPIDLEPQR
jgi:hypothetical protein